MITALNSNSQSAIQPAQGGLATVSLQYLNQQLAFYGTTEDSVTAATNDAATQQIQLQGQISNLQDTDMPSTILDMTRVPNPIAGGAQLRGADSAADALRFFGITGLLSSVS